VSMRAAGLDAAARHAGPADAGIPSRHTDPR
jgi:hypothetical protein